MLLRSLSVRAARMQGTGLPRISSALMNRYRRKWAGKEVEISDFQGDLRIAVDPGDEMGSRILWFDAYSRAELALVRQMLQPRDVFADVGANIGEFTLVAARAVGWGGEVIAFEPMPAVRQRLERHVRWNDLRNVTIIPDALGDCEDVVSLYAPLDQGHQGLFTTLPSEGRPTKVAEVRQTTLDSLGLKRLDGLKLDIEGAELSALRGGLETLKHCKPWIICEVGKDTRLDAYDPAEIISLLTGLGYSLSIIEDHGGLSPISGAGDLREWQNVLARNETVNRSSQ